MPTGTLERSGWERTEESVETVFELLTARVRATTVRYEDERTRRALEAVSDGRIDESPRFFAATRLAFEPPLPPGTTAAMVGPLLGSEVRRLFAKRLRERGLADVERDGTQRLRVGGRRRATVTKFTATTSLSGGEPLPLSCWVAVWTADRHALVVTGAHPAVALVDNFPPDLDAGDALARTGESYREEFFSLLRAVE